MRNLILTTVAVASAIAVAFAAEPSFGTFTDLRDGQTYKTVKMPDGKTWMAQNLNYKKGKSWCYDNNNSNCEKYGRLYDFHTAKTACPGGWHLPSGEEWDNLVTVVVVKGAAGKVLKSKSGWDDNGNGIDGNGFSALPGGRRYSDGGFVTAGYYGLWWTATEYNSDYAYYRLMYYNDNYVNENYNYKSYGLSVRCVQSN